MEWTEGRRRSFITSVIRGGFRRWPPKFSVVKQAFTEKKINDQSGRLANHYKCAECGGQFTQTNIQVDHINPVVSPTIGFTTWDSFIENLFCPEENLQVLCKSCHLLKSNIERQLRKNNDTKKDSKASRRSRIHSKSK